MRVCWANWSLINDSFLYYLEKWEFGPYLDDHSRTCKWLVNIIYCATGNLPCCLPSRFWRWYFISVFWFGSCPEIYIYIYKMYPVNRFKTNCGKSLIHFPAIWGLCWYNFFVAQVVWMILGKLPVAKMLNFHMLKKLHKRKLRTCKIWGKTLLTTVESTSAGAKIWLLWEVWFMKLVMPLVWIMNRNEQMQHKHMKVMVHIWICIGKISIQIGPANICLTSNHTLALPTKAGGLLGKIRHTFQAVLGGFFYCQSTRCR